MSVNELEKKCFEMKKELAGLKMQILLGQEQNSAKVRKLRRDIARTKTMIHLKKREESGNA